MRPMKRAIHLDFHTMPGIYNFNENWDAKAFANNYKEAKMMKFQERRDKR